jgi:Na+/melibiose symporter-like transporter
VVAGGLAQYAALPERLAYLVEIALLGCALIAVLVFLPRRVHRERWRPRRPTVPAEIRRPFIVAGISAFVAWAVTGLFLSLIPSFVTTELGHDNLLLAGGVVALMLAPAAAVQLVGQRLESLRAQIVGLMVMISGVVVLLLSDASRSLSLLIIAAVPAGLGMGLSFMGSLGDIGEIAPQERKGDIVASYYVVIYIGTALPAIGVGAVAQAAGLPTAVEIFAGIVIAVCITGLLGLIRETHNREESTPDRPKRTTAFA